jgi:hypothetical protein
MPGKTLDDSSTSTNLAGDAVFTGTGEYVGNYSTITVQAYASHASAANGLSMEFSTDNTNWDNKTTASVSATTLDVTVLHVQAPFFRLVYTNGATLTTSLRISALAHDGAMVPAALSI